MQQKVNRSYTIHSDQSQKQYLLSPYISTKSKRMRSLQKIRINQKGLPVDFFKPQTSRQSSRKKQKHTRSHTMPVESEQIRTTPQFSNSLIQQSSQPRQYKSQQRKNKILSKQSPFSQNCIQLNKQVTFSESFFVDNKQTPIKIKLKKQDSIAKNQFLQPQKLASSPPRRHLKDLMSKKYTCKDKYSQWEQGRIWPTKAKNTLPILKTRFPSAFEK